MRPKQKRHFRLGRPTVATTIIPPQRAGQAPARDRPEQLWQSDITYLGTVEGWLFLAAHHCREDHGAELVTSTFDQAIARPVKSAG
jgi:hypothetical protein